MAIIKKSEFKNMSKEEMGKRLLELRKELVKLKAQVARGTPAENPGKIRAIKRTVARLLMFIHRTEEVVVKSK
ncbi:50S ribosomal protein L29 [Candidatus Woesearchaeota archaeon]|nr:50S ribosomal protein L29 [Candidatus Woesearchaeota archaeon]